MNRIYKTVKNNTGDSNFISGLIAIFWILVVCVFFVQAAGAFKVHNDLSNAADKLMRSAELSGHTSLQTQADMLREELGIDFSMSWSGTQYIAGTTKVQLNRDIQLHLSAPYQFQMADFPLFRVNINVHRTGTSEIYYK